MKNGGFHRSGVMMEIIIIFSFLCDYAFLFYNIKNLVSRVSNKHYIESKKSYLELIKLIRETSINWRNSPNILFTNHHTGTNRHQTKPVCNIKCPKPDSI